MGRFQNFHQTNTTGNTVEIETNGNGNIPDNTQGNAASFLVNNTNSVGAVVRADPNKVRVGQVIGKALQEYEGNGISKIEVLVNVK